MNPILKHISKTLLGVAAMVTTGAGLASCNGMIYDDLDPCPQGVSLRFVFDYNMEFANAFPSQVDCLTLLVYDDAGRYVATRTETSSVLADENWRMKIDLDPGKYHFVAYGGMECGQSSFHFVNNPASGNLSSLAVEMNSNAIGANPGVNLHSLFFGDLDVEVKENGSDYTEATLFMMKDTNNLRIILQNVDGSPVNPDDFTFEITADNTLLDYQNNVVSTQPTTFAPWATGQQTTNETDVSSAVTVGFAEFSTSRLIDGGGTRLRIHSNPGQVDVLNIPLTNYLLLLKSLQFDKMGNQEFLDRESRWSIVLFLSGGRWLSTQIVVNGWTVRINDISGL